MMKVVSVNVGTRQQLVQGRKEVSTGIFKQAQSSAVEVRELGIVDDAVCDTRSHGGPDQALYIYFEEDYAWWSEQLGKKLTPGTFGENLTVSGAPGLDIGDTLTLPGIELQVTAPRIPCVTLAARMQNTEFVKLFVDAQRPGAYCRVLQNGRLAPGDAVRRTPYPGQSISIKQFFQDALRKLSAEEIQRYLDLPIDIRSRERFEHRLSKMN